MTSLIHAHWQNFIKERPHSVNPSLQIGKVAFLSHCGILRISGKDTVKFLQGQFTCDVIKVTSAGTLAAHCNPQGRIISLFFLMKQGDQFFLLMQHAMIPLCLSVLKKYAVFYQVQLEDISEQHLVLGFTLSRAEILTSQPQAVLSDGRRLVLFSLDEAKAFWLQYDNKFRLMTSSDWNIINLQNGLASIYPSTTGKFLPHEIGLHQLNAISFDKGCYTGQEIIARMHYRGKLKNQIRHFLANTAKHLLPGDEIYTQLDEKTLTMRLVDYQAIDEEHAHALFIAPQDYPSMVTSHVTTFYTVKDQQPVRLTTNEKTT